MNVKLRWEQPPAGGRRGGGAARIDAEVKALKKRPGVWAKLRDKAPAGNYMTYKKRGVLTRVSHVGNNKYDIWGCWFGNPDEPAEVPAANLLPRVVMALPNDEKKVVVREVTQADEGRVQVSVLDGTRVRVLKTAADRDITTYGIES